MKRFYRYLVEGERPKIEDAEEEKKDDNIGSSWVQITSNSK